jgi:hypothetical protein
MVCKAGLDILPENRKSVTLERKVEVLMVWRGALGTNPTLNLCSCGIQGDVLCTSGKML